MSNKMLEKEKEEMRGEKKTEEMGEKLFCFLYHFECHWMYNSLEGSNLYSAELQCGTQVKM